MRPPVGVGIVGLSAQGGWAAGGHVRAVAAVEGVELRALATSSATSAQAASRRYGVPGFTSVADLARVENVDLVVVAVKVPSHREPVLAALATGVAVLGEWPLAVDLREAEEMALAAGQGRTFVGLQGRASPTFRWLTDLVSNGYIGEVLSCTVVASSSEWGTPISERGIYTLDRALGTTMLTVAFGHAIDLVTMVLGEFRDVVATTATRRSQVPVGDTGRFVPMTAEDQIAVSGTLTSGAIVSVHHRGGMQNAGFSMIIDGTDGTLEVTGPEFPHLGPVTVRGARGRGRCADITMPSMYDEYPHLAGTAVHTLAHAYKAIRNDLLHHTTGAPNFDHAVNRHRLLDAIQRSAKLGRRTVIHPRP